MARSILGLSRREFKEKFNISTNTLQSWEAGRNRLTIKGAKRLSDAFRRLGLYCSDKWLLTGEGTAPNLLENVINFSEVLTEEQCILKESDAFKAINPNPVVVLIRDDGMQPIYNRGDYVAGNKRYDEEIDGLVGSHCIVETAQGDILIRKLLQGQKNCQYNLACINNYSTHQPLVANVKLIFAAQIVWHRTKEIMYSSRV